MGDFFIRLLGFFFFFLWVRVVVALVMLEGRCGMGRWEDDVEKEGECEREGINMEGRWDMRQDMGREKEKETKEKKDMPSSIYDQSP